MRHPEPNEVATMSMRTIERPSAPGEWDTSQNSDLVSGTFVIAVCFGLVCLFLIAMAH
jgi:hypothetical protein